MPKRIRQRLKQRQQEPDFKARSKRNTTNKVVGSERSGSTTILGHHQGSISSIELAEHLAKENQSKLPLATDLYLRSHMKGVGLERVLVSHKTNRVMKKYDQLLADCQEKGIRKIQ